jgi:hypothetical protein
MTPVGTAPAPAPGTGPRAAKRKRLAAVQSSYIPWKGYFDLMNRVDEFVLYDDVQYTVRNWRNRNRIKTPHGSLWLTIPVRRGSRRRNICDTQIVNQKWRGLHWRSIDQFYRKARFYGEHRDWLEELYRGTEESYLSAINYTFLAAIKDLLGIATTISRSTDYSLIGERNARLLSLCKQAGVTEYLSGPTARPYLDVSLFEAEGISVSWMSYDGYSEYRQLFCPPFIHEVSIVDLILNEGSEGARRHMLSFGS